MRKKQRLSIYDLGRIPVTPVQREESVGTLKQFRENEDRKAREAAATRQAEIERVQKNTSRLMAECLSTSAPMMSRFWGQSSLDKIKSRLHDEEVFDNLFLPPSDEKADPNVIYDAIQTFLDDDVFTRGYSLGDTSRRRFGLYVASQVNAGVIVDKANLTSIIYNSRQRLSRRHEVQPGLACPNHNRSLDDSSRRLHDPARGGGRVRQSCH